MSEGHLTKEQMLRVAAGSLLDGIDQHKLASLMGVNQGRVNEAIKAVEWALLNPRLAYKLYQGKAKVTLTNGDDEDGCRPDP